MAWSHSLEISTSNKVVIKIIGAADSIDASYDIPWASLSSLVSNTNDIGRTSTRNDIYVDNIEGSCGGWSYSTGRGSAPDNNISFFWLSTTSGNADEDIFIGASKQMSGSKSKRSHIANNSMRHRTQSGISKPKFVGKLQKGGIVKPQTSSMGNTNDDAFRVKLTTTPSASSFVGASFLVTFKADR